MISVQHDQNDIETVLSLNECNFLLLRDMALDARPIHIRAINK